MPGHDPRGRDARRARRAQLDSSSLSMPSRRANAGDTKAALPQVSFVSGFGSSCSHALFADAPSPTRGSGTSDELDAASAAARAVATPGCAAAAARPRSAAGVRAERRAGDDTCAQRRSQERVEVAAALRVPVRTDEVACAARDVAAPARRTARAPICRRRAARCTAAAARRCRRSCAGRPSSRARAPRGHASCSPRRLVGVQAVVNAKRDLRERVGEAKIGRRRVRRDWCRSRRSVSTVAARSSRRRARASMRDGRPAVSRPARSAAPSSRRCRVLVDRVHERMHGRRLSIAGGDDRGAGMRAQIGDERARSHASGTTRIALPRRRRRRARAAICRAAAAMSDARSGSR